MNLGDQSKLYIQRARQRKAEQLAFLCWASEIPSSALTTMTDAQWDMLAAAAKLAKAPSPETRGMVWNRLLTYEERGAKVA